MSAQVYHVTHPLVQHKLTLMRNKDASSTTFRTLLGELAMLMAYEVTRDTPTPKLKTFASNLLEILIVK